MDNKNRKKEEKIMANNQERSRADSDIRQEYYFAGLELEDHLRQSLRTMREGTTLIRGDKIIFPDIKTEQNNFVGK
jgi:hypothetical protein